MLLFDVLFFDVCPSQIRRLSFSSTLRKLRDKEPAPDSSLISVGLLQKLGIWMRRRRMWRPGWLGCRSPLSVASHSTQLPLYYLCSSLPCITTIDELELLICTYVKFHSKMIPMTNLPIFGTHFLKNVQEISKNNHISPENT